MKRWLGSLRLPSWRWAEGLSVRASLSLAFAAVLAGALALGVFSQAQMRGLNEASQTMYDQAYRAGLAAEQIRSALLRASRAQTQLLTATTAQERDTLGTQIGDSLKQAHTQMSALGELTTDADTAQTVASLENALKGFEQLLKGYVDLVKAQPLDLMQMSPDVVTQDARLYHDTRRLEQYVDELVAQRRQSASATLASASDIYQMAVVWMAAITGMLIVLAAGIGAWVTRRLTRQLGAEPGYAKAIAGSIAQGKLNMAIRVPPRGSDSLVHSLADMQNQLAQTLQDVAGSSRRVAEVSGEIASSNRTLAQRTDEQTSALAQTALNIRQMADLARRNAESAGQAATLTTQARQAAHTGGEVVTDVAQTMEQIDAGTRSIQSIIGVIEGIAFRTNILALNAAVEAAHAGEHGRGFAVVASEVRELAKRSADAAREINDIIHGSTAKVRTGVELTQKANEAIRKMTAAIESVSAVMADISAASVAQSEGIEEVNQAVAGLDETNQQNASLAQQGVVTARTLDEQARRLDELLSRFELGERG
jgi:methyl-accepting chemotaxis protein